MSELNNDVDEGLDPNFDPTELLPGKEIKANVTIDPLATMVPITENKPKIIYNTAEELKKELNKLVEKNNHIIDLTEVRANIVAENGINEQLALAVEGYVDNFINSNNPLKSYTKNISKVNFNYSLKTMEKAIANEAAKLKTDSQEFLVKTASYISEQLAQLKDETILKLIAEVIATIEDYQEALPKLSNSTNLVLPAINQTSTNFINLLTTSIRDIVLDEIDWSNCTTINTNKTVDGIGALQCYLKSSNLNKFLDWVNGGLVDKFTSLERGMNLVEIYKNINLGNLIRVYSNDNLLKGILEIKNQLSTIENIFSNLGSYINGVFIFNSETNVTENRDTFNKIINAIDNLKIILENLTYFNRAFTTTISGLVTQ